MKEKNALVAPPPVALQDSFTDSYDLFTDGSTSPNGKWKNYYGGYGNKGSTGEYFYQYPKTSTAVGESHASMTISTQTFTDFDMSIDLKTVQQLRQNSAPNVWEVGWIFFHFTDNWHNYALVVKTNGFQLEKKDNTTQTDCELFLFTKSSPATKIGQYQTIRVKVTNSASNTPRIQVWADGVLATDYTDNTKYQPNTAALSAGHMGVYCEDSVVNFDNVSVTAL